MVKIVNHINNKLKKKKVIIFLKIIFSASKFNNINKKIIAKIILFDII